jgi:alpha-1,3-glucosyltransferase
VSRAPLSIGHSDKTGQEGGKRGEEESNQPHKMEQAFAFFMSKLLLFPAYTSTDFEVHRNWLSITQLPLKEWYTNNLNQWTLVYPPLFAWWEWILNKAAPLDALTISSTPVMSWNILMFQRLSVLLGDGLLAWSLRTFNQPAKWLILTSPFFYIVDNIHFQYNSLLFSMLISSIESIKSDKLEWAAFWYTLLFNFKHIYLYIAPVYGIYYIRRILVSRNLKLLVNTAGIVLGITLLTYAPWIYLKQMPDVLSRLFPFKRGLTHSYWAPNFWALYNTLDRMLSTVFFKARGGNTGTKGLVQDVIHLHLPQITPFTTLVLTIMSMMPSLWYTWTITDPFLAYLTGLIGTAWASFLFGWHVHEKAISMVLIPMLIWATKSGVSRNVQWLNLQVQVSGIISLFPLLYEWMETPLKLIISFIWFSFLVKLPTWIPPTASLSKSPMYKFALETYPKLYLFTLPLYFLIFNLIGFSKFEFAQLMWTSVWCALGIVPGFIQFLMMCHNLPRWAAKTD